MSEHLIDIGAERERLEASLTLLHDQDNDETPASLTLIETLESNLASNREELDGKVEGYAAMIREMDGRAAIRDKEAKRFAALAKRDQHDADFLRARVFQVMTRLAIKKIETDTCRVSVVGNGGVRPMRIDAFMPPMDKINAEFKTHVPATEVLNKDAMRKHLEAGGVIVWKATEDSEASEWATLGERGKRLAFR